MAQVTLHTNHGDITLSFLPDKAPGHVENFLKLANEGFYTGTKFHRVLPGFMIQGGDPNSKEDDRSLHGMGDPGYKIRAEFNDTPHVPGVLSMARSGHPDSAGCQFFIMAGEASYLDGQYTAFGQVEDGLDVVYTIVKLPRDHADNPLPDNPAIIERVTVTE